MKSKYIIASLLVILIASVGYFFNGQNKINQTGTDPTVNGPEAFLSGKISKIDGLNINVTIASNSDRTVKVANSTKVVKMVTNNDGSVKFIDASLSDLKVGSNIAFYFSKLVSNSSGGAVYQAYKIEIL